MMTPMGLAKPDEPHLSVNEDYCFTCGQSGSLLCCDNCPLAFHFHCTIPPVDPQTLDDSDWFCPQCRKWKNPNNLDSSSSSSFPSTVQTYNRSKGLFAPFIYQAQFSNPISFQIPQHIFKSSSASDSSDSSESLSSNGGIYDPLSLYTNTSKKNSTFTFPTELKNIHLPSVLPIEKAPKNITNPTISNCVYPDMPLHPPTGSPMRLVDMDSNSFCSPHFIDATPPQVDPKSEMLTFKKFDSIGMYSKLFKNQPPPRKKMKTHLDVFEKPGSNSFHKGPNLPHPNRKHPPQGFSVPLSVSEPSSADTLLLFQSALLAIDRLNHNGNNSQSTNTLNGSKSSPKSALNRSKDEKNLLISEHSSNQQNNIPIHSNQQNNRSNHSNQQFIQLQSQKSIIIPNHPPSFVDTDGSASPTF